MQIEILKAERIINRALGQNYIYAYLKKDGDVIFVPNDAKYDTRNFSEEFRNNLLSLTSDRDKVVEALVKSLQAGFLYGLDQ